MEDQDSIDLQKVWQLLIQHKKRFIGIICFTTFSALFIAFLLPKQYESTVLIRARAPQQNSFSLQASAALALLGGGNMQSPTQVYMEMLKSRSVLNPVIAELDLPDEDKEKLDNEIFAKKYLKITNTKNTDLIEVAATGRTPEEAQKIASDVITAFNNTLTRINQSDQSNMVKFLQERMKLTKQEMEQAEQALEKFRQQEKIYVPDEQAKASITKLAEYDQKIAQLQVQNEANQAKLASIQEQLQKQNIAIAKYNIVDNPGIQQIRSAIVTKQVALVDLEQRYTEKNPNVIVLKKEIEELNARLRDEVNNSVKAGTSTLNPLHIGLVQANAETETELTVGQATLAGLRQVQARNEGEISKLSAASLTYIGLERQARITQEVYAAIVKNYEQNRIQEAMESMDIQIVDEANLPGKPSGPKKILITAIGGIVGVMLAFSYIVVLYNKNTWPSGSIKLGK